MKRAKKGLSLLKLTDNYVVIDLETTGLSPEYDEIIEIAAVKVVDGNIVERFSSLIKPIFEIPEFITELTGITNYMLSSAPTIQEVLPRFIVFLGDATLIGHNVNFDINFLYDACLQYLDKPLSNNYIDTMRICRLLFPDEPHHRLKDLRQMLNIETSRLHRALDDVIFTAKCYEGIKKYIAIKNIDFYDMLNTSHTKRKKSSANSFRAKDMTSTTVDFDVTSVVYNKSFVFTGTLERFSRKEAMQLVLNSGGKVEDYITKKTNFLVLANEHYNPQIKGDKSNKWKQAEEMKLKGQDIEIISEDVFYDMIEEQEDSDNISVDNILATIKERFAELYPMIDVQNHIVKKDLKDTRITNILLFKNIMMKVILLNDVCQIAVSKSYKKYFPEKYTFFESNSLPSQVYISISDIQDLKEFADFYKAFFDACCSGEIGCCSKYEECSDLGHCINPNTDIFMSCAYRRNLENGKVFYGKNAIHSPF